MHGLLDLTSHDPHKLPGPTREEGETMRGICGFLGLGGGESHKISKPTSSSSCQIEMGIWHLLFRSKRFLRKKNCKVMVGDLI